MTTVVAVSDIGDWALQVPGVEVVLAKDYLAEPRWMLVPARSYAGLLKFRAGLATYETLGAVADAVLAELAR